MPLYTFYCWPPNGSASPSFEARDFPSDAQAMAAAAGILAGHQSCVRVEVFEADRVVGELSHAS